MKFRDRSDHAQAGPLEAAYADMARAAGIDVMPTRLLPSPNGGPGYFATRRFDRTAGGGRTHVLSVAAMLEADWSAPIIDYNVLLNVTRKVTRDERAVEQMFRRMLFNVAAHNRDDHAKQHAFLMDEHGRWRLAPAYDLTLSSGPNGEHYLAVNGRGAGVTREDLVAIGKRQGIRARAAAEIFDRVRAATAEFSTLAERYGVPPKARSEAKRLVAACTRSCL